MIKEAYGKDAISKSSVYEWYAQFKAGRTDVFDSERSGRPRDATSLTNIEAVKQMVYEDCRVTVREISEALCIRKSSVSNTLEKELNMSKVCACWVPCQLTEVQMKNRMELSQQFLARFEAEGH